MLKCMHAEGCKGVTCDRHVQQGFEQLLVLLLIEGVLVQIHFISASCENMIDGRGMLPGDVLTASNGKTVEVRPGSSSPLSALLSSACFWFACHSFVLPSQDGV